MCQPYPPSRRANYMLGVLLAAYILSFVDRNVLAILVGPIRQQFEISDFQFSLLHGWAFTLFYIVLGVPIGWLADRFSRRWIIIVGVSFWSLMTALCGFAHSFGSLFLVRVGVGVGEATLSPAAYSLMSDYFPPERLCWATAVFAMGITLGTGASYMVGGFLYEFFASVDLSHIALLADVQPWQATFVTVGLAGFIVVALLGFVREPPRQRLAGEAGEPVPFAAVMARLRGEARLYGGLILGVSMMSVIGYGSIAWYPEMLARSHGMAKAEAGAALGLVYMIAGTVGTFAGAGCAAWLQRRGHADANMRWVMHAALLAAVPAVVAPLLPSGALTLWLFSAVIFLHYSHFGVAMAALQLATPGRMRGQVTAIALFATNLFGLGFGGSLVAALTDFVFGDDQALRYSLAIVSLVFYPLAAGLIAWGLASYRRSVGPDSSG
ncbi:MAG: MFS transporter, partial [Pseudomonadales bacterium]|nr:MFS transporter [Pseudomonadales bacterium]